MTPNEQFRGDDELGPDNDYADSSDTLPRPVADGGESPVSVYPPAGGFDTLRPRGDHAAAEPGLSDAEIDAQIEAEDAAAAAAAARGEAPAEDYIDLDRADEADRAREAGDRRRRVTGGEPDLWAGEPPQRQPRNADGLLNSRRPGPRGFGAQQDSDFGVDSDEDTFPVDDSGDLGEDTLLVDGYDVDGHAGRSSSSGVDEAVIGGDVVESTLLRPQEPGTGARAGAADEPAQRTLRARRRWAPWRTRKDAAAGPRPTRVRRAGPLLWIAGYVPFPEENKAERRLYATVGLAVLVTSGMAGLSMGTAAHSLNSVSGPWRIAIPVIWAAVVFSIELMIVRQIYYDGTGLRWWSQASKGALFGLMFGVRVLLSVALAFVISEPLVAQIFDDRIQTQMAIDADDRAAAQRSVERARALNDWYAQYMVPLNAKRKAIVEHQESAAEADYQMHSEVKGNGDCAPGDAGKGPCWERAVRALNQANTELTKARSECVAAVATASNKLKPALDDADTKAKKDAGQGGILAKLVALHNIESMRNAPDAPTAEQVIAAAKPTNKPAATAAPAVRIPTVDVSCEVPRVTMNGDKATTPNLAPIQSLEDFKPLAAVQNSRSATSLGQRQAGVTKEESTYVWWAHRALLLVLLIIDLIPLLGKQLLRWGLYSSTTKKDIRAKQVRAEQSLQSSLNNIRQWAAQARVLTKLAKPRTEHAIKRGEQAMASELAVTGIELIHREQMAEQQAKDDLQRAERASEHNARMDDLRNRVAENALRAQHGLPPIDEDDAFGRRAPVASEGGPVRPPASRRRGKAKPEKLRAGDVIDGRWKLVKPLSEVTQHAKRSHLELWLAEDQAGIVQTIENLPSDLVVVKLTSAANDSFRHEMSAVIALGERAPNIARVLGHGTIDDAEGKPHKLFVVHPYYPDGSLRDFFRSDVKHPEYAPSLDVALFLTDQVLRGLSFAHKSRLLHLDIKPDNVVVWWHREDQRVFPYLIDWGTSSPLHLEQRVAVTNRGPGTLWYAAPEQFNRYSGQPDERCAESDIYGVAATLYWLLAKQPPLRAQFEAEHGTNADAVTAINWLTSQPRVATPLHVVNPAIPREISDLVSRWLSPNPLDRVDVDPSGQRGAASMARLALSDVHDAVLMHLSEQPTLRADDGNEDYS